ncbi:MAG: hypothetical protein IKU06_11855 [Lachnospiraceae bacterium]|nr:hypothetical protein [Lachnospiraceae bacterium]
MSRSLPHVFTEQGIYMLKGRFDTLVSLVKDGLLSLTDAAKRAELSTEEFKLKAGL